MNINVISLAVNKLLKIEILNVNRIKFNYLIIFQKTQIDQNVEDVSIEATRQLSLEGESEISKQSTSAKKRRTRLRQKIQAR